MSAGEALLRVLLGLVAAATLPAIAAVAEGALEGVLRGRGPGDPLGRLLSPYVSTGRLLASPAGAGGRTLRAPLRVVAPWIPLLAWVGALAVVPVAPRVAVAPVGTGLLVLLVALVAAGVTPAVTGLADARPAARVQGLRSARQAAGLLPAVVLALAGPAVAAGSVSLDAICGAWRWWWPLAHLPGAAVLVLAGLAALQREPLDAPARPLRGQSGTAAPDALVIGARAAAGAVGTLVLCLAVAVVLLGGWAGPWPHALGWLWLLLKTLLVLAAVTVLRVRLPRPTARRAAELSWGILVPVALAQLVADAVVVSLA